ncbi:endonuclease/exonuclease/phosphatase family protein [Geminicoccus roseus]|uniref:endonuclease/exonuclease/phosphatase family protein n=1 Tax=Geminicoccus roseus TaxID=404900 RepID=UPI000484419C|nr:endonuclease/exonuclease/phosphatase family protein [Geminicoccus roseus]
MIRSMLLAALLALGSVPLLGATPARAADDPLALQRRSPGQVTVMTQNQYIGADLAPLLNASSPVALNDAVLEMLRQAAANRFVDRVQRQARQIVLRQPDLVGLQEVFYLGCRDLPPRRGACADPSIAPAFLDQLAATMTALQAAGGDYEVAARVVNFDLREILAEIPGLGQLGGVPFTIDGRLGLLTAYDQDVILKRRFVATQPVRFPGCRRSAQGCNYRAQAGIRLPITGQNTGLGVKRGFVAVDAALLGRTYRFVNTHLEVRPALRGNASGAVIQAAQARELLAALGNAPMAASRALIVVGDFNSSPADTAPAPVVTPYAQFVAAGFVDAWQRAFPTGQGFTCCQAADLRNERSLLYERIDPIFARPPVLVQAVRLDGRRDVAKTGSADDADRLWPSDHAGVTAQLKY